MNFTLKILGTASALPIINRYPSAQVLDVRGRLFLIDCGEGTQVQMRRMGISYLKLEAMFLSHIHGDHVFGLFGLLSTMGMLGRTGDFHIFAPRSFGPILKFFLSYFGDGINYRIEHHVLSMDEPEVVYSTKFMEVMAFPLNHKIDTYGFLFRELPPDRNVSKDAVARYGFTLQEIAALKRGEDIVRPAGPDEAPSFANGYTRFSGTDSDLVIRNDEVTYVPFTPRSYAYCSDTAPFARLGEWVRGVDLLYHEATYPEEMADKAALRFHSTAIQAATLARDAAAGKLIIGHYSSKYPDLNVFLNEARTVFGNTFLAQDCSVHEVALDKVRR